MDRRQADTMLAALGQAQGRIAAAMFNIDSHPGLGFLRSGSNRGRTQAAWIGLAPSLDAMWSDFSVLNDLMESARANALGRKVTEFEVATLQRAAAVAARLEAGCASVLAGLNNVNRSWSVCGAAMAPLQDALNRLTALASELGESENVAVLNQRSGALRQALLDDPLTAAPWGVLDESHRAELSRLTTDVASAGAALSAQATMRDSYPARVADLRGKIEAVREEESRTANSYREATEEIAASGLPPAPSTSDGLNARILDLEKYRQAKRWHTLAGEVSVLESSIARARDRAERLREAADGLVMRRDELRERLDSYRTEATLRKVDDNEELAVLHRRAHTLLYTTPCDLPEATRAVFAYQTALTKLIEGQHAREDTR
jgi:hypothetical protein